MNQISFAGVLESHDYASITDVIAAWLGHKPHARIGPFGEEIYHDGDGIELYCHTASPNPRFLLEGKLDVSLDAAKSKLEALAKGFQQRSIEVRIEYVEVDEDWNQVGEELEIEL